MVFFLSGCSQDDSFSPTRKALIDSYYLLKGSLYCLNEKNYQRALKKVDKLEANKAGELDAYFKKNGINDHKMISEILVRSLCSINSIFYDRKIEHLTDRQLEGIVEESTEQVIRELLNIKSYRGDGTPIRDRMPPINNHDSVSYPKNGAMSK